MAVRLHLKIGLVGEQDRLESSPDAILVSEPSLGATSRSKGSLYVVVTAGSAARSHDATRLIADTIRREYYYDESAGIPICLQKAIRSANRRVRHGREGHGLKAGSIGVVVAVVRGYELYVASAGDAEAYLVRQARLMTLPADDRRNGLPADEDVHVGVWRGEMAVGDSLILVSGNLIRGVGTDELKNAVVTLHPQSAAEHLHHLFVAGGGTGSDGILALEATEVATTRVEPKLVPVRAAEPLAGAPDRSPIPLADPLVAAATAVQDRAQQARVAAGGALLTFVDRITELLPQRGPQHYRQIAPASSRREFQRRAALALLASLGVVLLLGFVLWVWGRLPGDERIPLVNAGEGAVARAEQRLDQAMPNGEMGADRSQSLTLLRQAWDDLATAQRAGVAESRLAALRVKVTDGLDQLYNMRRMTTAAAVVYSTTIPQADMIDLVPGPDGASYSIERFTRAVMRYDPRTKDAKPVVTVGDGPGDGIGVPWQLAAAGRDVLILDTRGGLWRWTPSNTAGRGTLGRIPVAGNTPWGSDVTDTATFVRPNGIYNLYVVDPSAKQILRYLPAADGSRFPSAPTGYLRVSTDVSGFRQLYIDGDIYALTPSGVTRYIDGRTESLDLEQLPDDGDLRPGHDYRLFYGTGDRAEGHLYFWDAKYSRIVVYDKGKGTFLEQFTAAPPSPAIADLRGMYIVEPKNARPIVYFVVADRLITGRLQAAPGTPGALPSASPGASPSAAASATPRRSASPSATRRPSPSP
jgi:hypothetical protein